MVPWCMRAMRPREQEREQDSPFMSLWGNPALSTNLWATLTDKNRRQEKGINKDRETGLKPVCAHTHVFTFPTPVVGILHRAMLGTLWLKLDFLKSQDSSILSSQPFYQLRQCLPATHRCPGLTPGAQAVHSPDNAAICRVRRWGGAVGGGWHGEWGREGLGGAESIHVSSHWHVSAHHRN